ncbi:hypothetical protein Pmani_018684 [Petrolisthes manimaculis]|uniref:Uncharacterized protein n=1 Tax=Petrolisthes manimaculis TaxID=1843537 RepID=A0AAE1PL22_9EUCA|nr:hypothetical protein Pmani_018684 [Petrolisthes manimaculis]
MISKGLAVWLLVFVGHSFLHQAQTDGNPTDSEEDNKCPIVIKKATQGNTQEMEPQESKNCVDVPLAICWKFRKGDSLHIFGRGHPMVDDYDLPLWLYWVLLGLALLLLTCSVVVVCLGRRLEQQSSMVGLNFEAQRRQMQGEAQKQEEKEMEEEIDENDTEDEDKDEKKNIQLLDVEDKDNEEKQEWLKRD